MAVKITVYGEAKLEQIKRAQDELKKLESQARTSATGFSGAMSRMSASMVRAGGGIKSVGESMTRTMTPAIGAAAVGIWKATQMASDLAETASKVKVIFGKNAGEIQKWAGTAATAMGQSKQEAMDAAATFAMFGQSAGLTGSNLVGFSQQFTQLASDMASFNNTSPQEAITAVGAALRGEMEPIRRYNVMLDDASMRQEALAMGLVKTTSQALTPQQKVLAASSLIFKKTGQQQGDFARTADGLANQQRIATAELKNQVTELGTAFIPMMKTLVTVLRNQVIPMIKGLAEWFKGLSPAGRQAVVIVGAIVGAMGPLLIVLGTTVSALGKVVGGVGSMVSATKTGVGALRAFSAGFTQPASGASAFASTAQRAGASVRTAIGTMATAVKNGMLAIGRALMANPWILVVAAVIAAVVLIVKNWDKVKAALIAGWNAIKSAASHVWGAIVSVVKAAGEKILAFIRAYFDFYKTMAGFGLRLVQGLWNGIKDATGWVLDKIKGFGSSVLNGIKDIFGIASPSKETTKIGAFLAEGIAKGMTEGTDKVKKSAEKVGEVTKAALVKKAKEAQAALKKQIDALKDKLSAQLDAVASRIQSTGDNVMNALSAAKDAANRMVDDAQDSFGQMKDAYDEMVGQSRTFAADMRDSLRGAFSMKDAANGEGSLLGNLRRQVSDFTAFAGQVKQLRTMGLNQASLTEIVQAGVAQGTQIAAAVLAGGASAVQEINALESQLSAQASELGDLFAQDKFGAELAAARQNLSTAQQSLSAATAARDAMVGAIDALIERTNALMGNATTNLDRMVMALGGGMNNAADVIGQIIAAVGGKLAGMEADAQRANLLQAQLNSLNQNNTTNNRTVAIQKVEIQMTQAGAYDNITTADQLAEAATLFAAKLTRELSAR